MLVSKILNIGYRDRIIWKVFISDNEILRTMLVSLPIGGLMPSVIRTRQNYYKILHTSVYGAKRDIMAIILLIQQKLKSIPVDSSIGSLSN